METKPKLNKNNEFVKAIKANGPMGKRNLVKTGMHERGVINHANTPSKNCVCVRERERERERARERERERSHEDVKLQARLTFNR
jgi:hypothetical protein